MLVLQLNKADYDTRISEMKKKYFTASDYNNFTSNTLDTKIAEKNQLTESGLNEKTKSLATKEKMKALAIKVELKVGQDKKQ